VDLGRPTLAPIDPLGELARVESDRTTTEEPRAPVR
jgi:hypothetical protein